MIRTRDLYVPNVALYQAEPHSGKKGTTEKGLEPLLTESESAVLPITPFRIMCSFALSEHILLYSIFSSCQQFF